MGGGLLIGVFVPDVLVVEAVGFRWRYMVAWLRASGLESTANLVQISTPLLTSHADMGNCLSSPVLGLPFCTMGLERLSRLVVSHCRVPEHTALEKQSIGHGGAEAGWGLLGALAWPWPSRCTSRGILGSHESSSLELLTVPGPWTPSWNRWP